MVFKKCRETDEVLFIDASKNFEKGKNENYLRPSDVDKIVETFQSRTEEEKFSHCAHLDEIAENDYNLNIPRYVDTFEKESDIDLTAVTANLKQIEQDMTEVDETIKAFCAELGLEAPV
jgi:type I restriction enzyme M protein